MKSMKTYGAAMLLTALAAVASAQVSKSLPGTMEIVTVTVESIEKASREVTIKKPDGSYGVFSVSEDVKRFDTLKIGDKVTAKYYDNIVLRLKPAGEKSVDTDTAGLTRGDTAKPVGTAATQRTITATITQIDLKVPSITFKGPNNWTYSSHVEDLEALKKVKVGDRVDITWTEAVMISVEAPSGK